jgi:hypothetical protein
MRMYHRSQYPTWNSAYTHEMTTGASTADHKLVKWSAGTITTLGTEAVDLSDYHYLYGIDISGSSFKCYRAWVTAKTISSATAKFTATDTAYASGYIGIGFMRGYYPIPYAVPIWFSAFSRGVEALAIAEMEVEGSGRPEDPYRPSFSSQLIEIPSMQNLPSFLYREARKYQMLRNKGFSDEEIELLLGYAPQRQVDLDSVTWGAFEFHPDKASTVVITITGDNPYKPGAIERQAEHARRRGHRIFVPPKNYDEAVALYKKLKSDFPHWLAGVHNWCYQIFGYEFFDWLQNVDFYYGELMEHKTHYNQLKRVPDREIEERLKFLEEKIKSMTVLIEERDKHLKKIREIFARGW